jgi:chorismate dehydratase
MMQPRISASSYSNTAPLVWSFVYGSRRGSVELILDTAPARSAELLLQKRVSAALVPVIAYHSIPDVRLVSDVCVGARERVRSVCLVTRGMDLADVRSVALDTSSRTSAVLTKIVFREFLGFDPVFRAAEPDAAKMLTESDCALLIGDPALAVSSCDRRSSSAGANEPAISQSQIAGRKSQIRAFDLVELWRAHTGLGFVFAMWMSSLDPVGIDFSGARDEGLAHIEEIISSFSSQIPLPRSEFREYLSSNISYSLDDSMHRGLGLFFELASRNGLIGQNRELRFAG